MIRPGNWPRNCGDSSKAPPCVTRTGRPRRADLAVVPEEPGVGGDDRRDRRAADDRGDRRYGDVAPARSRPGRRPRGPRPRPGRRGRFEGQALGVVLRQARASRNSHGRGQRTKTLEAIRAAQALPLPPGRSPGELRTEAIAALVLPDLEDAFAWEIPSDRHFGIDLDRRFERFGWQDRDGTAEVRRVADGALLARLPGTGLPIPIGLTFSPTGAFVVSRGGPDGRTRLWDLRGPEPTMRSRSRAARSR